MAQCRAWFLTFGLLAPVVLTGCFGEDEEAKGPKKDYILVRNDSSTEAQVRMKMWKA
jgi:hypothetical protein